ncbi:MAG: hypothetical protein E4G99_13360, partial [Anaerolineales bacterium]
MTEKKPSMTLPRWELESIFPGIGSDPFNQAFEALGGYTDSLMGYMDQNGIDKHDLGPGNPPEVAPILRSLMEQMETIWRLNSTLGSYLYGFISTDSFDMQAMKKNSELELLGVRIKEIRIRFWGWLASSFQDLQALERTWELEPYLVQHDFFLKETFEQARYQMSMLEETLTSELALSGANAWSRLQGTVTSQ